MGHWFQAQCRTKGLIQQRLDSAKGLKSQPFLNLSLNWFLNHFKILCGHQATGGTSHGICA